MNRLKLFFVGGACIALAGCALINPKQPNVSAQPPADKQIGAVSFLEKAKNLEQQEKYDEAAAIYAKIIDETPSAREAYEHLILIHLELDHPQSAENVAKRYRKQFPDSASPLLMQAAIFNQEKKPAAAEKLYRDGSERFPENEDMLLGLGLTLARQSRIDEAAEVLDRKMAETDNWSATLYAFRSQLALMSTAEDVTAKTESIRQALFYLNIAATKDPENAELWLRKSELERVLKDYPAATHSLEILQKLLPENSQICQALVPLYLQQGEYTDALTQITLLVKQQSEQVSQLIALSTRHALAMNQPKDAIMISKEGARLLPENIDVQFLLGFTLIQNKQFAEAEASLAATRTTLYAEQPNSFDPRLELFYGIALLQQQKTDQAAKVFTELAAQQFDFMIADYLQLLLRWDDTKTLSLLAEILFKAEQENPDSAYLPYFRALILQQQKQYTASLQAFGTAEENAENLGEKRDEFLNENFYFQFASASERCNQFDKAEVLFRKAIGLNPKYTDAMNYLAYMWAENNTNLSEAQELITHVLEIQPDSGAFIDTLGWIYYQQQKYEQAMEALTKAEKLAPKDPDIQDHLGDCALKLGRPQEARKHWLKSVSFAPDEAIQAKADAIPAE